MRKKKDLSMRLLFSLLMIAVMGAITAVSWLGTKFLQHFRITLDVPEIIWLLLISLLLGSAATAFIGRWILEPIKKLENAMGQVAAGNFDIRMDTDSGFQEIRSIHESFNRMVEELGATEILQTNFVSNVSHEFKTPISAIEGYTTLLQTEEEDETTRRHYVEKILLNTKRLSALVGNILLLSKLDNQAIPSKKRSYRLDEQIRQSILFFENEWTKKEIEFDIELDSLFYCGNESMLMHVWNNLIGNAVKFSPEGGYVGIKLIKREEVYCFMIEDRGPGIEEENRNHIFDRFFQSDSSHKQEGNGLGLALVKSILDSEGGRIEVENIPKGGCRFTVYLE